MARTLSTLAAAAAILAMSSVAAPANAQRPERQSQTRVEREKVQSDSTRLCTCDGWMNRDADLSRTLEHLRSFGVDSAGRGVVELRRRLERELPRDLGGRAGVRFFSDEPCSRLAIARAFEQASMSPDRAVLGVTIGPEASTRGLEVVDVSDDGPAARAGIKAGDILTAVDGASLQLSPADSGDDVMGAAVARRLTRRLDSASAGDTITLRITGSAGPERTVQVATVRAEELVPDGQRLSPLLRTGSAFALAGRAAPLGVRVRSTDSPRDTLGVFVSSVVAGSAADRAGIHEGMRVVAVNGRDLRVNPADVGDRSVAAARVSQLERALADVDAGESVVLKVREGSDIREITVKP